MPGRHQQRGQPPPCPGINVGPVAAPGGAPASRPARSPAGITCRTGRSPGHIADPAHRPGHGEANGEQARRQRPDTTDRAIAIGTHKALLRSVSCVTRLPAGQRARPNTLARRHPGDIFGLEVLVSVRWHPEWPSARCWCVISHWVPAPPATKHPSPHLPRPSPRSIQQPGCGTTQSGTATRRPTEQPLASISAGRRAFSPIVPSRSVVSSSDSARGRPAPWRSATGLEVVAGLRCPSMARANVPGPADRIRPNPARAICGYLCLP
jgi:hypothetical protein